MKKVVSAFLSLMFIASLTSCSSPQSNSVTTSSSTLQDNSSLESAVTSENSSESLHVPSFVNTSPDKYTWYVKDYVNKNAASCGYYALNGMRMDSYGAGHIKLVFVTETGDYVDIENDDTLKEYVIKAQNISPNTEIKYTFQKDSDGNEYDNLVDSQNIEEIVLGVVKVGSNDSFKMRLTEISASPDKYTHYIKDYTGRNLASCGYISLAEDYRDTYGVANIILSVNAEDGSYIDVSNADELKNYIVTQQNIAPNTEITMTMMLDSEGNEYSNLVQTQSIESIDLYVVPITVN